MVNIFDQTVCTTVCTAQTTVDAWQAGFCLFHELTNVKLIPTSPVGLSFPFHIPARSARAFSSRPITFRPPPHPQPRYDLLLTVLTHFSSTSLAWKEDIVMGICVFFCGFCSEALWDDQFNQFGAEADQCYAKAYFWGLSFEEERRETRGEVGMYEGRVVLIMKW